MGNNFRHIMLRDGSMEIVGYNGNARKLKIPAKIDGNIVTNIGLWAFEDCVSIESITIGNGVRSIGRSAFRNCKNLISIIIPNSVTYIGRAFEYCTSLKNIEVNEKNTSYSSLNGNLYNKNKTELLQYAIGKTDTSFTIPDGVTSINKFAFADCKNLTSVTIPDGVASIDEGAFCGCERLISITIPNTVTSIGDYAFDGCKSLTSITIPNSVTSIGRGAFEYCTNLKT